MKIQVGKGLRILVLALTMVFAGCSGTADPTMTTGIVGGLLGGGIGAGTGALFGSSLANGDIARSALVGGAIGIPVGVMAGVAYRSYIENRELRRNRSKIEDNYEYIVTREQQIEQMREDLSEDSFAIRPNRDMREEIFTGATIGVPIR